MIKAVPRRRAFEEDALTLVAIIMTLANGTISPLHDRMPLVVEPDSWEERLLGDDPAELLWPAAEAVHAWHQVGFAVGNIRNDEPLLIAPLRVAA